MLHRIPGMLPAEQACTKLREMQNAHADGQMVMEGASIADGQPFHVEGLHVGADLSMRNVKFGGEANFLLLVVDGGIDLRNSHTRRLNLTRGAVRDDLVIGGQSDGFIGTPAMIRRLPPGPP